MSHVSEGGYICTKTGFILVQGGSNDQGKGLGCHRTRASVSPGAPPKAIEGIAFNA